VAQGWRGEVALGLTGDEDYDVAAVEYKKKGSNARSSGLLPYCFDEVLKLLSNLISYYASNII
jgi:hypothetical protein